MTLVTTILLIIMGCVALTASTHFTGLAWLLHNLATVKPRAAAAPSHGCRPAVRLVLCSSALSAHWLFCLSAVHLYWLFLSSVQGSIWGWKVLLAFHSVVFDALHWAFSPLSISLNHFCVSAVHLWCLFLHSAQWCMMLARPAATLFLKLYNEHIHLWWFPFVTFVCQLYLWWLSLPFVQDSVWRWHVLPECCFSSFTLSISAFTISVSHAFRLIISPLKTG